MEREMGYCLTEDDKAVPEIKYEYLDHTADVQIHACESACDYCNLQRFSVVCKGGNDLREAFEQCAMAMFAYMTEIETVQITDHIDIEVDGDDEQSLLFKFLDEFLFNFSAEPYFIARKVKILEFDSENYRIKARGFGETFDLDKHPQETEVKAITYSAMQVHEKDVFVIIDI